MVSWSMSHASRNSLSYMTEEVHVTHSLHPWRNKRSDFLLQKERKKFREQRCRKKFLCFLLPVPCLPQHPPVLVDDHQGFTYLFDERIRVARICRWNYITGCGSVLGQSSRGAARHLIRINWIAAVTPGCLLFPVVVSSCVKVRLSVHCLFLCLTVAW